MMKGKQPDQEMTTLLSLPVIGICGSSGVGKTTLIEQLVPRLVQRKIRLAIVKHDAHNVRMDRKGKDSYRFYQAGADVMLLGKEQFFRVHDPCSLNHALIELSRVYDCVIVEGHARTPVPKIWLLAEGHASPPENQGHILKIYTRKECADQIPITWIEEYLVNNWLNTPVWGCVLIGGKSRRMGTPKHLITTGDATWLEHTVAIMRSHLDKVVLSGSGDVPGSLDDLPRIPDVPELAGPLAGILAIQRLLPSVSWIVVACDQPAIQPNALTWLLNKRAPGVRIIFPQLDRPGKIEPLLAYYDLRSRVLLEQLAASGSLRISHLAGTNGVRCMQPPADLHSSWLNINTQEELQLFTRQQGAVFKSR